MGKRGKVLLVYPPSNIINRDDNYIEPFGLNEYSQKLPPYDLMLLASIVNSCNYEAIIKDYSISQNYINDIADISPVFIVANITAISFKEDINWLKEIKEKFPIIKIIVKGTPFLTYNNAIYENPFIDYVIYRECEFSLKEILNNVPENEILGICYRENFQSIKNEPRDFIKNLDLIPLPNRNLINNSLYKSLYKHKTQTTIEIERGYPFDNFISLSKMLSGSQIRHRSIKSIIKEIKGCINKHNIKHFYFKADIFNFDEKWINKLCSNIINESLNITWSTRLNTSLTNKTLIKNMYKSGCRLIDIDIISGDESILSKINNNANLEKIINTISLLKNNNIEIHSHYIIGLPWETEDTVKNTIQLEKQLDCNYTSYHLAVPYPGTIYFAYSLLNKLSVDNLDLKDACIKPIVKTHTLTIQKIQELYNKAIRAYYLKPKTILRELARIRSVSDIRNTMKIYSKLFSN